MCTPYQVMSTDNSHSFDWFVDRLKTDPKINRNELRSLIEALIKIYRNLVTNKCDQKFRKLKVSNASFGADVWRHPSAQDLLLSCGWDAIEDRQFIVFSGTDADARHSLTLLVNNRDVRPDAQQWVNAGKQFLNPAEEKERELREKAAKEKARDLEAFAKDKEERQRIQENVKKEIQSDIRFRQQKNQNNANNSNK